jgi:hypothetical protein
VKKERKLIVERFVYANVEIPFRHNGSTTDQDFYICQILEKIGGTLNQ